MRGLGVDPAGVVTSGDIYPGGWGRTWKAFAPVPDQRYILTTTGPDRAPDPCRPALGPWSLRGGGRAPGGPFWTHPNWPVGGIGLDTP